MARLSSGPASGLTRLELDVIRRHQEHAPVIGVIALCAAAAAMETRHGGTVVVGPEEIVHDDLYAFGDEILVEGTILGDAVLVGGAVDVSGAIGGDLVAAARTVGVSGTVDDDVRAAGADVRLAPGGRVGGDWVATGGRVVLGPGSAVARDVSVSGGSAVLAGAIAGDVDARAGAVRLDGPVGGAVDATVGLGRRGKGTAGGLVVGPGASLGVLRYEARSPPEVAPDADVAETHGTLVGPPSAAARARAAARAWLGLVLVGGVALLLVPRVADRAVERFGPRAPASLGLGLLVIAAWLAVAVAAAVVVTAAASLAAVVGLGGLAAVLAMGGLAVELAWALLLALLLGWLGQAVTALALGETVLRPRGLALALGLGVLVVLQAVPYVGPAIAIVAALLGLGALAGTALRALPRPVSAGA